MDNEKILYITNEDGEIIDTVEKHGYAKLNPGDRVLKKQSVEYLSKTKSIKYFFIKVNPEFYSSLSIKYPILNSLIKYISYMDGILAYSNGKKVMNKNIHEAVNMSKSTAKRQIQGLISDDVLHKIKEKNTYYYIFNPWICMRGKKITYELYKEFKESIWKIESERETQNE